MNIKTFNLAASVTAFIIGTAFLFTDSASITANVIGASGSNSTLTSVMGMMMMLGSIGLFIVSMSSTDNHGISLERLIRGTKFHEEIGTTNKPEATEEYKEYYTKKTEE